MGGRRAAAFAAHLRTAAACAARLRTAGAVVLAGTVLAGAPAATIVGLERLLDADATRVELPRALTEVSGLTLDGAGGLWAHADERAELFRVDPRNGEVTARRALGPRTVAGDFEGLAWDGALFHLVTSSGTLVSFPPGESETVTTWSARETDAARWCEVEGVEFDPRRETLVLACKVVFDRALRGHVVLLEVDLPARSTAPAGSPLPVHPVVRVDAERLRAAGLPRALHPSGIAYDAGRDLWLLVAARQARALEVSRDGEVLGGFRLRRHPQVEGIALARDGATLYLADEGGNGRGRLTVYRTDEAGSP